MYVMFDSVTLSEIPESANAVAGYVGGRYETFPELEKRWPRAKRLSIAVNAHEDAECLDIESGDAVPAQAPDWLVRQEHRGVVKPVLYGSQSTVAGILEALGQAHITRSRYRVWSAHYTGVPHIEEYADATQWTDRALGRNLDESLCKADFFSPVTHGEQLGVLLLPELRLVRTIDHYRKHPREHEHGIRVTLEALIRARKLVWLAAVRGHDEHGWPLPKGWDIRDRKARYDILWQRTGGKDHA